MSKVTSKRQVTIPKELADRFGIEPGDEVEWIPAGDEIRVVISGYSAGEELDTEERLRLFDRATERRDDRASEEAPCRPTPDRGWTREELYGRGGAG